MGDDRGPIEFWSEDAERLIERSAKRYSVMWRAEREDLRQEAYCAVLTWIRRYGADPVSRPLFVHIINWHLNNYVYKHRKAAVALRDREPERFDRTPPDDRYRADLRLDVCEAMNGLTDKQRRVVVGRYFEFRSFDELAQAWGLNVRTMHTQIRRAFDSLKSGLAGGYGPAAARLCDDKRSRDRVRRGHHANWSTWGPIPNQRDDD